MNRYPVLLAILLILTTKLSAQITINEFNANTDYHEVAALCTQEWDLLFLLPFDQRIINRMFIHRRPGDTSFPHTELFITVIKEDEAIRGFITYYYKTSHVLQVELLAVDKNYRGKGYGKRLLEHAFLCGKKEQARELQLYVFTRNKKGIEFYTKLGFSPLKKHPLYLLLAKPI